MSVPKLLPVVNGGLILSSDILSDCQEPILPFLDLKYVENG